MSNPSAIPAIPPLTTTPAAASSGSRTHPPRGRSTRGRPRGRGRGSGRARGRSARPNPTPHAPHSDANASAPSTPKDAGSKPVGKARARRARNARQTHGADTRLTGVDGSQERFSGNASRGMEPGAEPLETATGMIGNADHDATEMCARLSALMSRGALECPVCLERIRRDSARWNCPTCFTITHLHCVRKWMSRGKEEGPGNTPGCPSCRSPIPKETLQNVCYCRRRKVPPVEPGITPGSCGEPCLRSRGVAGSSCQHACMSLCHPGPCQPCVIPRPPRPCFCGKTEVVRMCGEVDGTVSCGNICGRMRACGHACDRVCHEGPCGDCVETVSAHCFCGRKSVTRPCRERVFNCGSPCGRSLQCGRHKCEKICHDGDCMPCKFSPEVWTTCACGKREMAKEERESRTNCSDAIPSCGGTCGKSLGCVGAHLCKKQCGHSGDCGKCEAEVEIECRCSGSVISAMCGEDLDSLRAKLICDKKCNDRLTCRHHNCQVICCPFKKRKAGYRDKVISSERVWASLMNNHEGISNAERRRIGHKCSQVCKKQLACGKHTCDLTCGHASDCPPCGLLEHEPLFCTCGAERIVPPYRCGTVAPECKKPCSIVPACGHACAYDCHLGACPPCVQLVKVSCVGGHGETRFVQCHIGAKGIRCHRSCGRPLLCGVHACQNACHGDFPRDCETSSVDGCTQRCGLPRMKCGHSCMSRCHPGLMCPDVPCKEMISVTCPCGRRQEKSMCLCGGQSTASGDDGGVRLSCDEECSKQSRLRGFASALGKEVMLDGTVVTNKGVNTGAEDVKYSEFLLRFAESEPRMLAYFEKELANIVNARVKKVVLNGIPKLHRMILHTLAELYLLDSESSGRSSSSRQMVIRHRGAGIKPTFPVPLLSEAVLQREQERKKCRQTESRSMSIHISSTMAHAAAMTMEAKVAKELKEHEGFYRIVGPTKLSCKLVGLLVEFSTMERAVAALSSLKTKQSVIVERGIDRNANSANTCSHSSGVVGVKARPPASSRAASSRDVAPETSGSSWADDDTPYGVNRDRVGSVVLSARPSPLQTANTDNVPDSWED